jgi:beta-RFAP synthase
MTTDVRVRAACRLHFGMFAFGDPRRSQFGGVGAMIEPPGVDVCISPATRFAARGTLTKRVRQFVELLVLRWKLGSLPACRISVQSPDHHTGLGVGTQLGLAVASGLRRFLDLCEQTVEELAVAVGRGTRSAVGTRGFEHGGLIVDAGKDAARAIGELADRADVPADWRFVLFRPRGARGIAGASEAAAFARLPPVPEETTRKLWSIATDQMLPAVRGNDCTAFGEAVYRFGKLAGECFSRVQRGAFTSDEIAELVLSIRQRGVSGVGQSSWGPTVFAITADESEAECLTDWFGKSRRAAGYQITVGRPHNTGATIEAPDACSSGL